MAQYDFADPPVPEGHEDFKQVMILPERHRAQTPLRIPIIIKCTGKSIDAHNSAAYQVTISVDAVNGKWVNPTETGKYIEGAEFESRRAHMLAWHPDDYCYFVFEQPSTLKHIEFKQVEEETEFFLRAALRNPYSGRILEACSFNLTVYPKVKEALPRSPIIAKDKRHNEQIVEEIFSLFEVKLTLK